MYYPILIALIGIATLLKVGTRCMAFLGFQTFVQDDEISMDYVEEGKQLLNRGRTLFKTFCLHPDHESCL